MTDALLWLISACALYLLLRLNLWYWALPKEEREENEREMFW